MDLSNNEIPDTPDELKSEEKQDRQLGVVLFALGRSGMIHFENLLRTRRYRLIAVVEERIEHATQILKDAFMEDVPVVLPSGATKLLEDPEVGAVIIASPTHYHFDTIMMALSAGKAVFCEKPLGPTLEKINECYAKAEHCCLPLHCSFNRRFDPSFIEVRHRYLKGELGVLHHIKTVSRDCPPPSVEYLRISGGIFHDMAVHDLDIVSWIVGAPPVQVFVMAYCHLRKICELRPMDVDTVVITLKWADGTLGTIDLSRGAVYGYDQRLELFGERGMLQAHNRGGLSVEQSHTFEHGISRSPIYYSFPQRYSEGYAASLDHFCDVVFGLDKLNVTRDDTLLNTRLAIACDESLRKGLPIRLDGKPVMSEFANYQLT